MTTSPMGGLAVRVVYASVPFSTVPKRKWDAGIELSSGQEGMLHVGSLQLALLHGETRPYLLTYQLHQSWLFGI